MKLDKIDININNISEEQIKKLQKRRELINKVRKSIISSNKDSKKEEIEFLLKRLQ